MSFHVMLPLPVCRSVVAVVFPLFGAVVVVVAAVATAAAASVLVN